MTTTEYPLGYTLISLLNTCLIALVWYYRPHASETLRSLMETKRCDVSKETISKLNSLNLRQRFSWLLFMVYQLIVIMFAFTKPRSAAPDHQYLSLDFYWLLLVSVTSYYSVYDYFDLEKLNKEFHLRKSLTFMKREYSDAFDYDRFYDLFHLSEIDTFPIRSFKEMVKKNMREKEDQTRDDIIKETLDLFENHFKTRKEFRERDDLFTNVIGQITDRDTCAYVYEQ